MQETPTNANLGLLIVRTAQANPFKKKKKKILMTANTLIGLARPRQNQVKEGSRIRFPPKQIQSLPSWIRSPVVGVGRPPTGSNRQWPKLVKGSQIWPLAGRADRRQSDLATSGHGRVWPLAINFNVVSNQIKAGTDI